MKKTIARSISLFLAIVMLFSLSTTYAFAMEENAKENIDDILVPIADENISREEAISILGLTEEDAQNLEFYTPSSARSSALGNGVHDLGTFSFTNSNGGSYRTINGTKVMYGIQYKQYPSPNGYYTYMWVHFVQYGGKEFSKLLCQPGVNSDSGPDSNGFYTFKSNWVNINYGVDYRFMYYLLTLGDADGTEYPINATVRVVLAVYNPS